MVKAMAYKAKGSAFMVKATAYKAKGLAFMVKATAYKAKGLNNQGVFYGKRLAAFPQR